MTEDWLCSWNMPFKTLFILWKFHVCTILIYAPHSPLLLPWFLTPSHAPPIFMSSLIGFFFFYNQTESNKQLPSSHTLEANFSSSPRCQEFFSLEVEPHKPLPHSSWDYWPVWTCAGNHGHREFMSTAPMSGPGDSMSQSSSTFPSSYTEICLRDIYDSPKPLFVPLKGHDWITFPFPVSPGVCKDTYQGLAKERQAEWYRIFPCMAYTPFPWMNHPHDQLPHLPVERCRLQAFPSAVQIPHPTQRQQLRGAQCQEKQASGVRPRTLREGKPMGRHHRYHCWCHYGDHFGI